MRLCSDNERLSAAQRENRIGAATEAADIAYGKEKADPSLKRREKLSQLVQLYRAGFTNPDDEEYVLSQIRQLMAEEQASGATAAAGANPNAGTAEKKRPVNPNYAQSDVNRRKMSGL